VRPVARIKVRRFIPASRSCGLIGYFSTVLVTVTASEIHRSLVGVVSALYLLRYCTQSHLPK
jgi:hypothetical protein